MKKFWRRDPRFAAVTPKSLRDAQLKFCSDLALMKHQAMELGLFRTMHRIDDAVRMVGFEAAGTPDLCIKMEKDRERVIGRMNL